MYNRYETIGKSGRLRGQIQLLWWKLEEEVEKKILINGFFFSFSSVAKTESLAFSSVDAISSTHVHFNVKIKTTDSLEIEGEQRLPWFCIQQAFQRGCSTEMHNNNTLTPPLSAPQPPLYEIWRKKVIRIFFWGLSVSLSSLLSVISNIESTINRLSHRVLRPLLNEAP